jgi:hypothetical protein
VSPYELVRSGDVKCIRLRRRIVAPVAHLAESLGVDWADVWDSVGAEFAPPPKPGQDSPAKPVEATSRRPKSNIEVPSLF